MLKVSPLIKSEFSKLVVTSLIMIYNNDNTFSYLVHLRRIGSCKTTNHSTTVIEGQVTSVAKRMQLRMRVDKRSLLSMRPSGKS